MLNTETTIAIISALGNVLATTIPSLATFFIGRLVMNRAKLKEDYSRALLDILFLLNIEDLHCRDHKEVQRKSMRQTIRNSVVQEKNLDWSGKNTPSLIKRKLEKLK